MSHSLPVDDDSLEVGNRTLPGRRTAPWYNVPALSITCVEHPFVVKNVSRALETLGGPQKAKLVRISQHQLRSILNLYDSWLAKIVLAWKQISFYTLTIECPSQFPLTTWRQIMYCFGLRYLRELGENESEDPKCLSRIIRMSLQFSLGKQERPWSLLRAFYLGMLDI